MSAVFLKTCLAVRVELADHPPQLPVDSGAAAGSEPS